MESGTSERDCSTDLIMVGSTISASTMLPASSEYLLMGITRKIYPNRPNTMEGMPESVSVNSLIIFTNMLFFLEYSFRYIAAPMPSGSAITSASTISMPVDTNAGASDTCALLLSPNRKSHERCGMP